MHQGTTTSRPEKSRGSVREKIWNTEYFLVFAVPYTTFCETLHPEALGTPSSRQGWHDDTPVMALMENLQLSEWLCTWNKQSDRQTKPHQPLLLSQNPMGGSWDPAQFAFLAPVPKPAGFKCTTFWRYIYIFLAVLQTLAVWERGVEAEVDGKKMVNSDPLPWERKGTLSLLCLGGTWRDREPLNTGESKK